MRVHLFPSRTQKLSSSAPTIVAGRLAVKIGNANISSIRKDGAFSLPFWVAAKWSAPVRADASAGGMPQPLAALPPTAALWASAPTEDAKQHAAIRWCRQRRGEGTPSYGCTPPADERERGSEITERRGNYPHWGGICFLFLYIAEQLFQCCGIRQRILSVFGKIHKTTILSGHFLDGML